MVGEENPVAARAMEEERRLHTIEEEAEGEHRH
jgi:hypothetical protein